MYIRNYIYLRSLLTPMPLKSAGEGGHKYNYLYLQCLPHADITLDDAGGRTHIHKRRY